MVCTWMFLFTLFLQKQVPGAREVEKSRKKIPELISLYYLIMQLFRFLGRFFPPHPLPPVTGQSRISLLEKVGHEACDKKNKVAFLGLCDSSTVPSSSPVKEFFSSIMQLGWVEKRLSQWEPVSREGWKRQRTGLTEGKPVALGIGPLEHGFL